MFIAWQKAIGGRLKSDCSFSNTIVWNNLPLPEVSPELRERIIEAGKNIEQARAQYPSESLASLYSALGMHPDLIRAHEQLDRLVDRAFGGRETMPDGRGAPRDSLRAVQGAQGRQSVVSYITN